MDASVWIEVREDEDEDEEGVLDMLKNLASDTKIKQQ